MAPGHNENWFVFQNDKLLITNQHTLLSASQLIVLFPHFLRQYPIGTFNHTSCYCAEIDKTISLPEPIISIPLRNAFEILGSDWFAAATKSFSVVNWDRNHQICGRCGHQTQRISDAFERTCTACGLSVYPRISPSMIVLIQRGDEILMARSPHFQPGIYALIAGFVEIGESIEETIHREVKEEVGLEIKNLRYFGSQPWPFPDSLMIGFIADYASGEIQLDHDEIEAAGWYRYDQLPGLPSSRVSISRRLIDHFVAEQKQKSIK